MRCEEREFNVNNELRASLIREFPELGDPEAYLEKEIYAHFGAVMFKFALIEHSLINIFIFASSIRDTKIGKIKTKSDWEESIDCYFEIAKSKTFGNLINGVVIFKRFVKFKENLLNIKKKRNYFAHHFFREDAAYFSSADGCWFLLEGMHVVRGEIDDIETRLGIEFQAMMSSVSMPAMSDAHFQEELEKYREEAQSALRAGTAVVGWEKP
ncbi:MAG: hypothetical protein K0S00_4363 [Xanthobacteraceae bacterium]|jgi:hypothetical protein|nr:hypothetical protein [Xanthobacteraceae bacterium]